MDTSYLHDAFKDLDILDEEIFDISKEGSLKEAEAALAEEPDDVIDIMDMEFEDSDIEPEEDAEVETHVGDVIFDCPVCHSKLYKHPDEVELDEFEEYANVGEECPYCFTSDGFKIIGQVAPYQPEDEVSVEVEDKEEVKDSEDDSEVDDKDVNESLKKSRKIKEEFDESIWDKFSSAVKSRLNDAWNSQKSNSWFNPYFTGLVDAGVIDEKTKKIMLKSNIEDGFDDNLGESFKRPVKKSIKESKEVDLTEYQKWVDYDMRKYHKISENTMSRIKKAGLSVVKDQYGEYEVIADRPDSDSESFKESKLTEKNWSYTIKSGAKLRRAIEDEDYEAVKEALIDCYSELFNEGLIDEDDYDRWTSDIEFLDSDSEDAEDEFDYELNDFYDLCDNLNVWVALDESLQETRSVNESKKRNKKVHEGFEKVEVETDDQKITVKSEPKEEVPGETMLAPVSAEVKDEIKIDSESEDENSEDEVDYDISEFSEDEFDELGESYLKRVYENVESFKTTFVGQNKNNLVLEGLIKFTSGNEKKTRFVFESFDANKDGKVRFLGENQQISRGKKSFTLRGSVDSGKFIAESFNYNYKAKTPEGKSTRVYGTVKVKK